MERIETGALHRIQASSDQQKRAINAIRQGRPLGAEFEPERVAGRMQLESLKSVQIAMPKPARGLETVGDDEGGPERIWGNTVDFVGVAFLQRGADAARAVGRVAWRSGRAQGTGFLVAPALFLTNNHVLGSEAEAGQFVVEFDYEIDGQGHRRTATRFEFAATDFFITDDTDDLDYTLIAIGSRIDGPENLDAFGYNPMSAAGNKHALGEVANIVQHPDGRMKEVVLRENRLVSRLSHVLHYVADTEPGSSGSPVFNNQWQAIALHHWGGPWRQRRDHHGLPVPRYVNEGIRISAIASELEDRRHELTNAQRQRLDHALLLGESTGGVPQPKESPTHDNAGHVRVRSDGTAVWRVPIEIAIGVPGVVGNPPPSTTASPATTIASSSQPASGSEAFKRTLDKNYENRRGYRERFIRGHVIPMPNIPSSIRSRMAKNLEAEHGDDELEFPYEHFSVYVDGKRGLPLVTACNIDGKSLKSIDRKTGRVSAAETLTFEPQPEAREKWYMDPRIATDKCGNDDLYTSQRVSGGPNRLGRIFHRGHMVRRLDPCWGTEDRALRAEADTFHFTNCTPQVGKFNSGKTLWQGIENHVLDNAKDDEIRVTVFTGTVLRDDDPDYRQSIFPGFKVPLQFWKIAVWAEDGVLSALAMIADQTDSLKEIPESAEAIDDDEGVRDFITTVPHIESLTGLDFGAVVRDADLYEFADGPESMGRREVTDMDQIPTKRHKRSRKAATKKTARKARA